MMMIQDEWMTYAGQIDAIQGNEIWGLEPGTIFYEPDHIPVQIH